MFLRRIMSRYLRPHLFRNEPGFCVLELQILKMLGPFAARMSVVSACQHVSSDIKELGPAAAKTSFCARTKMFQIQLMDTFSGGAIMPLNPILRILRLPRFGRP